MARVDFVYLAESARIDSDGALHVLGASFRRIRAESLPGHALIAIVGQMSFDLPPDPAAALPLTIKVEAPGLDLELTGELQLKPEPIEGLPLTAMFVAGTALPLTTLGVYTVTVSIDDQPRTMRFRVDPARPHPAP